MPAWLSEPFKDCAAILILSGFMWTVSVWVTIAESAAALP